MVGNRTPRSRDVNDQAPTAKAVAPLADCGTVPPGRS
jgi:hypothetical protein